MSLCSVLSMIIATMPERNRTITTEFKILQHTNMKATRVQESYTSCPIVTHYALLVFSYFAAYGIEQNVTHTILLVVLC